MKNIPQTIVTDVKYLIRHLFSQIGMNADRETIEKTFYLLDDQLESKPQDMPLEDFVLDIIAEQIL